MARGAGRRWKRVAFLVVGVYALYCTALFMVQGLLFFPGAGPVETLPPPANVEALRLTHPDGVATDLWFQAAAGSPSAAPLVVYLHGNGDRIDRHAGTMTWLAERGFAVGMPEYRGYGQSEGTPGEAAVTADLVRAVELLRARAEVDASRVIYYGVSLGTCFAAQLAAQEAPRAMVLQTPFLRTDVMALRYAAPPFLVRNPFRADVALRGSRIPTLLLKHRFDQVAPPEDADALHALLPESTLLSFDADHGTPPERAEAVRELRAIEAFLDAQRSLSRR